MQAEHYLFHVLGVTSKSRMKFFDSKGISFSHPALATDHFKVVRDGVMVMCNGNALQCITIFKVMGSNV